MAKYPYMEFYPNDWKGDPCLQKCSLQTRGAWMELLCSMHLDDRSGIITGTVTELARICGCQPIEIETAIDELKRNKTADVTICNENVTIINRRMRGEYKERNDNKLRVNRHRNKTDCNEDVTPVSRLRALNPHIPYTKEEKDKKEISKKSEGEKPLTTSKEIIQAAERIASKHPRLTKPIQTAYEVSRAIDRAIEKEIPVDKAIKYLEAQTERYAEAVSKWPKQDRQYIVNSENWYKDGCYSEDPELWKRDGGKSDDDNENNFVH